MLFKVFLFVRVGPTLFTVLQYGLLVCGLAFIALAIFTSLFIPADDGLRYSKSSAWRRESQSLTGQHVPKTPAIRVSAKASANREMKTYYSSLLDVDDDTPATKLNSDLCNRLRVVDETSNSCTESEYDYDD